MISTETTKHYLQGAKCDGWHLLKRNAMGVIQERVPAGGAEVMHYHEKARQIFYILEGEGRICLEDREVILEKGIEIELMVKHQFRNQSQADVHFLVISVPSTRGERINL